MSDHHSSRGDSPERGVLRALGGRAVRVRSDLFFAGQDAALVGLSFGCILLVRFGGQVPDDAWRRYLTFLPLAIAVYLVCHWRAGLYGQIWRFASVLRPAPPRSPHRPIRTARSAPRGLSGCIPVALRRFSP